MQRDRKTVSALMLDIAVIQGNQKSSGVLDP